MHRGTLVAALAVALCNGLLGHSAAPVIAGAHKTLRSPAAGCKPLIATIGIALPGAMAVDQETDRVFVAGQATYSVYLLNATTGAIVRQVPLEGRSGAIAIDGLTNHVFVADVYGHAANMLSASIGSRLHTVAIPFAPTAITVASHEGHVFTAGYTGTVSMLDARSGSVLRTLRVGDKLGPMLAAEQSGRIFIGTETGVYALDARTGALVTALGLGMSAHILTLDHKTGDVVAAGEKGGPPSARFYTARIAILSGDGGRILRSATIGKYAVTAMVDAQNGNLFVSRALTNAVDVVDLRTLRVKRTVPLPQSVWGMAVMPGSKRVFVASYGENPKAGVVTVLDSSGKVIGATAVGSYPQLVAADEATQRIFVTNMGGAIPQEPSSTSMLDTTCWPHSTPTLT